MLVRRVGDDIGSVELFDVDVIAGFDIAIVDILDVDIDNIGRTVVHCRDNVDGSDDDYCVDSR